MRPCRLCQDGSAGRQLPYLPVLMVQKTEKACHQKRALRSCVRQKTTNYRVLGRFTVHRQPSSGSLIPAAGERLTKNKSMPTKLKRFVLYWFPLILYCLLIYIQSANPSPEQIPSFPFVDKVLHFAAYGIMGILFYRAYQTLPFRHRYQMLMLLSVVSASLYGISDEIHQHFVPYRDADILDVIADFLGAACGVYLYQLWVTSRKDRKQRVLNSEVGMRKAELKIRDKRN